jgi:hypothetical protein
VTKEDKEDLSFVSTGLNGSMIDLTPSNDYDEDSDYEDKVEDLAVTIDNVEGVKVETIPDAMRVVPVPDIAYKT